EHPAHRCALGRFGWKANQATLDQQVLAASRNDMGITDSLYPTENCLSQEPCLMAPQATTQPNLEALLEQGLVVHAYGLAVPARRNVGDPTTARGEVLFGQ